MTLPQVGARLSQGPWRGTVRFVGEVPSTLGTWVGVEWDDVGRGKHDGVHNGVRYFTCRVAGNVASFIRPSAAGLSFGSSFLQALRQKYAAEEDAVNSSATTSRRYARKNLADIEVEAPNLDGVRRRMAQLDRLREVGLGGWKMEHDLDAGVGSAAAAATPVETYAEVARAYDHSFAESMGDIASTCPSIRYLDLSRSLLPSWEELAGITAELPKLDTLLLHWNRFAALTPYDGSFTNAFASLKDLRLDGTLITCSEMRLLATSMPVLESLQLAANRLRVLDAGLGSTAFPTLRVLNLSDNEMEDWPSLMSTLTSDCPRLERLILHGNRIATIPPAPPGSTVLRLQHLSLSDNALQSWSDLDNLTSWLGDIRSLVISPEVCPFLVSMGDVRNARLFVIARMADSLGVLNHATISTTERRDAELYYLSAVERQTAGMSDVERNALHRRYNALMEKHGQTATVAPAMASASDAASVGEATLRSKLLPVRIFASTSPPTSVPPYISLPPTKLCSASADGVESKLLITTPLRMLQAKIARTLGLTRGARSIASLWALLSAHIDPLQTTALHLREEMRPGCGDGDGKEGEEEERIVYQLTNLDWDLAGYNFSHGDHLVVVLADV